MIIGIEAMHANKPNRTGVEWYCYFVIEELKKIIPPSVRVILYTKTALAGELGILPTNWEQKILRWPLRKFWSQTRLAYELWRNPPDVFSSYFTSCYYFKCTTTWSINGESSR